MCVFVYREIIELKFYCKWDEEEEEDQEHKQTETILMSNVTVLSIRVKLKNSSNRMTSNNSNRAKMAKE